jgi:hypothetical protein
VEPGNVLLFTFDNPLMTEDEEIIVRLLETYVELKPGKGTRYVLLDEIQYVPEWSRWLKTLYDRGEDMRFVVSGSSGRLIFQNTTESLTGRITFRSTHPFSFHEYCSYHLPELRPFLQDLRCTDLNGAYASSIMGKMELHGKEITGMFNRYLLLGGIPQTFGLAPDEVRRWLKDDYLDMVFYRDLLKLFEVRDVRTLEEVFYFASHAHAQRISLTKIASALGARLETVKQYLGYLEAVDLVQLVEHYSGSLKKSLRAEKKVYITDTGIRNAVLGYGEDALGDPEKVGSMVEGVVAMHLHNIAPSRFPRTISYWRAVHEVDLVVSTGKGMVPIEIKHRRKITHADLKGLLMFMSKYDIKRGLVLTRDLMKRETVDGKDLLYLPSWLFLLINAI